jgi:uncharacterized protein YdaU (DUF1376 family)
MKDKHKSPAFQFYVQDFVAGTIDFTALEIGAYLLLLCRQWDKGELPNDPEKLKTIGRCGIEVIQVVIEKFEVGDDGKLRNARLEKIRSEQEANRKAKSKAGIEGNKIRWNKSQGDEPAITEDRSSSSSSININKENMSGNFFYIGTELHRIPVTEFLSKYYQEFMNLWEKANKPYKAADVLKQMDKECIGKQFSDEAHIQNTFNKIGKELTKPKVIKKNAPEGPKSTINWKK